MELKRRLKSKKMGNEKVARQLVKVARSLIIATTMNEIKAAVEKASSFMNVGKALKDAGIKYDFSTSPMPIYMTSGGGATFAIVNKKYAENPDAVVGNIAIGML